MDGFVPYGPIVAGKDGLAFFTIRSKADPVTHFMPGAEHPREKKSKRQGFAHHVRLDHPKDEVFAGPFEDGLEARRVYLKKGQRLELEAPKHLGALIAFGLGGRLASYGRQYPQ